MYNKKEIKRQFIWIFLMLLVCGLTACGETKEETSTQKVFSFGDEKVYLDEVWIYAETVIQGYEQKYGQQVWSIETKDEDETIKTMEEITRKDIIENIRLTKTLASKADAYGIKLSDSEKADALLQSEAFYSNLTDVQINEMGIKKETAQRVFEENLLANKVYNKVIEEGAIEVSDESVRKTTIYDLYFACFTEDAAGNIIAMTEDEKKQQLSFATEALNALHDTENPVDYDTLASRYALKHGGKRTLSKAELITEYGESLTETIYGMENGTYSQIVETEYGYHIIGVIALTDEEATATAKAEVLEVKQKEYFQSIYVEWASKIDKNWSYEKDVDKSVYEKITFVNEVQQ